MGVEEGTSNGEGADCAEGVRCFRSEVVNNDGFGFDLANDSGDGSSGASESFRTYKRRRQLRSSSEIGVHDHGRASTDQVPLSGTVQSACLNGPNGLPRRQWGNVVLENMHQLSSGDEGGIQHCIQDALMLHLETGCNGTAKESDVPPEDRLKCLLRAGKTPNGTKHTAEGLEGVIANGKENPQTTTEMCQRVFFDVIMSEKFTSLCKLIVDNFQGVKVDSLLNLSLINSRMKNGVYEHSPMLFSSDIQRVWRKLQEIGAEIVSLAKSLSNISSTFYSENVGRSCGSSEDEKHQESESLAKKEHTGACGVYKVCAGQHCGEKANGKDCLVCDSCEEMYHVACIEPAVKEIPPKSWYCASCTADGKGSSHENCVICERLNDPRTFNDADADENHNVNCEAFTELEEHSNSSFSNGIQSLPESKKPCFCKLCGIEIEKGEKLRGCEHAFCLHQYHVRCLTTRQLQSHCSRWYCPSCLCRACLTDRDDDKIVLCDGCDEAYHIYCMKPPRTSVPRGKWFCRKCDDDIQRIRRAKRTYQYMEGKLKRKGMESKIPYGNKKLKRTEKDGEDSDKSRGGVDMLLTAANTLSNEEKLTAR